MFGDPNKKDFIFTGDEGAIHRLYVRIKNLDDFFNHKVW